jgi:hypothetical protein
LISTFLILLFITNSADASIDEGKETLNSTPGGNSTSRIEIEIPMAKPLILSSSEERGVLAFIIAGIIVFSIFGVYLLSTGSKIVKDEHGYPSLAKFQMLIWTVIIMFAFLGIYLTRIFEGILVPPPAISANLLALMGITIFIVPMLNKKASDVKYGTLMANSKIPLVSMLQENNETQLTRVQMFGWTLISVFIYVNLLYSSVLSKLDDTHNLILPDIDPNLVILMGISQGGYLAGKSLLGRTNISAVTQIKSRKDAKNRDIPVTITGANFGDNQGEVFYDNTKVATISLWTNNRIDIAIPFESATAEGHTIKIVTSNQVTKTFPFNIT